MEESSCSFGFKEADSEAKVSVLIFIKVCATDWLVSVQNFYVEAIISDVTELEIGSLRRWLKSNEFLRVEFWSGRTSALIRRERDIRTLYHEETGCEGSCLQARKRELTRTRPCWPLISDFQTPELWKKILLFKWPSLWYPVMVAQTN